MNWAPSCPSPGTSSTAAPTPTGHGEFFYAQLDQRLKYRFRPESNAARAGGEDTDRDDRGPFLWVSAVILSAHHPGQQPHSGMRDFAVDLAYVVDPTLAKDSFMDPARVDYVGVVEIDDDVRADAEIPHPDVQPADAITTTPEELTAPLLSPNDFSTSTRSNDGHAGRPGR